MPKKSGGPRRRRLNPDAQKKREAAIISDLRAGVLSYRMIAEKHHVSLPTVNAKARKAGITRPRGRRPLAASAKAAAAAAAMRNAAQVRFAAAAQKTGRSAAAGRSRPSRGARPVAGAFREAFREMVLHYFPGITLAQFDKLARLVEENVR